MRIKIGSLELVIHKRGKPRPRWKQIKPKSAVNNELLVQAEQDYSLQK